MPVTTSGSAAFKDIDEAEIHQIIADKVAELIDRGFDTKTDPNGRPWAPDKNPKSNLLERTGALRRSIKVTVEGSGLVVRSELPYADPINLGTYKMPARGFVPVGELPAEWRREIDEAVARYIEERT